MSTRSSICVKTNGKFKTVYCHFDGYLSGVGKTLFENYGDQEKAESIVELGDLSSLNITVDCPEGHSYDSRAANCSVFYGRDRGEDGVEAKEFDTYAEALAFNQQEFNYIFEDGKWFCGKKEITKEIIGAEFE